MKAWTRYKAEFSLRRSRYHFTSRCPASFAFDLTGPNSPGDSMYTTLTQVGFACRETRNRPLPPPLEKRWTKTSLEPCKGRPSGVCVEPESEVKKGNPGQNCRPREEPGAE